MLLTKNRIALILLSQKLDDNPAYAEKIGVSVDNKIKADNEKNKERKYETIKNNW